jgi:hypothetical protein
MIRSKKSFAAYSGQIDAVKDAIQKQQSPVSDSNERQQQRASTTKMDVEIAGSITIAGFVADHVFGDKKAAQQVLASGNAVRQIYGTIAKFVLGDIGPMALTGGLLGAADIILGLFGGGGPDPVTEQLQHISSQLKGIANGPSVMERKANQILQALQALYDSLYEAVKTGDHKADANLRALKQLVAITFDQLQ